MTLLQQLTAKIYASNPELMTLGVGCEIDQIIDYIQEKELLIPIESFFNEDGSGITKKKYGEILLKILCEELKTDFAKQLQPPTLVDVLKWLLDELKYSISDPQIQYLTLLWLNSNSIYLRDQSEELVNFLLNLSKTN